MSWSHNISNDESKLINYIMITGNEDLTSKNDDELFVNRK